MLLFQEDKNPENYNTAKVMMDFTDVATDLDSRLVRSKDKNRIKFNTTLEEIRQVFKKFDKKAPRFCSEMLMIQDVLDEFVYKLYVRV